MQFLLPWQKPDLKRWAARDVHPLAPRDLVPSPFHDRLEVTLAVESPGEPEPGGPFARLEHSVLSYRVFGHDIGHPVVGRTPVQVGDTIGLVYSFLGILRLFFASRVVEVFEREPLENGWRSGFVYQTLEGHPELGEEIFEIRKDAAGAVTFRIEAWSRPNLWFVKLFTFWARTIQKAAAQSAATNLAQVAAFRDPLRR
jgi:uncharacterized protein (UPF0548 family)